jgi:gentisate 1,2-dioxygenase
MTQGDDGASAPAPELESAYADALRASHLAPLWRSIRSLIPYGMPTRSMQPAHWRYTDIRPLLVESGALVPIELAERRALVLCNPGFGAAALQTTPSIFIGFQLLLPGESASNHRHVASALRLVVEGRGGYTTVDGERLPMEPGDLVLTPGGCWHEHGQDGTDPVIWLDALDVPLVHYLEASTSEPGAPQHAAALPDASQPRLRRAGLAPYAELGTRRAYPLLRFPWREVRAALLELAASRGPDAPVHLAYVNPLTGEECLPTLGCSVLMLRPREERRLPRRSASAALHVICGAGDVEIDGTSFRFEERDVVAVPTHACVRIGNRSADAPAFVFMIDDAPLQRKMRIYREFEEGEAWK